MSARSYDTRGHDYAYAEALLAYAHNPDGNAEGLFRSELESPEDVVRAGAAADRSRRYDQLDRLTEEQEDTLDASDCPGPPIGLFL